MPPVLSYAPAPPRNRFALLGLICGLVFVPFVSGALAIRFGLQGRRDAGTLSGRGRFIAGAAIGLGCLSLIASTLLAVWFPFAILERQRRARQIQCMMQLRAIGQAVYMYVSENRGYLPSSLDLVRKGTYGTKIKTAFMCPECQRNPSKPVTVTAAGPSSYIYAIPPPSVHLNQVYSTTVLAYEPLSNHDGRGMCALYADGTVRWWDAKRDQKMIASILAGKNQIRQLRTSTSPASTRQSPARSGAARASASSPST